MIAGGWFDGSSGQIRGGKDWSSQTSACGYHRFGFTMVAGKSEVKLYLNDNNSIIRIIVTIDSSPKNMCWKLVK